MFVVATWIALGCWAGLLLVIYLFDVIPGSCTSGQESGIVIVLFLLFAFTVVMLADIDCCLESGIVMVVPLLFGYTVVMARMFLIAGIRGCTCDEGFARMSVIST